MEQKIPVLVKWAKDKYPPIDLNERYGDVVQLVNAYNELQSENENINRLLHDLTPGGSEFYNDPERCFKWVKETWFNESKHLKEVIKELRGKNGELTQRNATLLEVLEIITTSPEWIKNYGGGALDKKAKQAIEQNTIN